MDLSNPLAVVTPTLDAAVLQALASTTGWTSGAEVHRRGRTGSADGVRKVLARLVHQGIVMAQEHRHATLYSLNRDHVAADALVSLTLLRSALIRRITEALAGSPAPLTHASLFGSFARGEATDESDIDLLVVVEPSDPDTEEARQSFVDGLARDVERWTGNRTHVVILSVQALATMVSAHDPLVDSWRADHVHLAGARLPDLLRRHG